MTVSNTEKYVFYLNEVEDIRLDGYTIYYILGGLGNSWVNEIPTATPDVSAEETEREDDEEEVGALEESCLSNPQANDDNDSKKRSRTTSRERRKSIGPGNPICVGLGSDGTGLDADDLKLICVICGNDAVLLLFASHVV